MATQVDPDFAPLTSITTIHEQDTTERILEQGEAEASSAAERPRQTALEGSEKWLHIDCIVPHGSHRDSPVVVVITQKNMIQKSKHPHTKRHQNTQKAAG